MSRYQILNGNFLSVDENGISPTNRSFTYGDGFFESMRVSNGKIPFAALHWNRLLEVCAFLRIQIPEGFNLISFNRSALALCAKNGQPNARVRFQGFRGGKGRYTPTESVLGWSMMSEPFESSEFVLNKKGLHLDFCDTHTINPAPQSSFKTSNSLPYILAGFYVQEHGLDDCFLVDSKGNIAESSNSNIFLVKGNRLITPDLKDGGVSGVMRTTILQIAKELDLEISVSSVTKQVILEADECFLSNATSGIQWVGAVHKKRYFKKTASRLIDHINQEFGLAS